MINVIADSSGLLALIDGHSREQRVVADSVDRLYRDGDVSLVLSPMVLAEMDDMLVTHTQDGLNNELAFLNEVRLGVYDLASWDANDFAAANDVVIKYRDLRLGIADAGNVVLAKRFRTTTILTLDEEHFRSVTPLDGGHFTLLPADSPR